MKVELHMPKYGMSMVEGEVMKWLKAEGDHVSPGDQLVEVEENKATHTLESEHTAVVEKILVPEGETAPVGAVLAVLAKEE